jgi:hypothetical protein
MTDFNVSNNFNFKGSKVNERVAPDVQAEVSDVPAIAKEISETDLSLDPSAVIGKSQVVEKTPKYDLVLMESVLKFLREEPEIVEAYNNAYEQAIEAGMSAMTAAAFAEEALMQSVANKVKNSNYIPPNDSFRK